MKTTAQHPQQANASRRPTLATRSLAARLAALALAAIASAGCLGVQLGLQAMYSGEAQQALAALRAPALTVPSVSVAQSNPPPQAADEASP